MHADEGFRMWGEAFGVVCWLWVFHRARNDLPVLLGFRHPWEHADDGPFAPPHHHHRAMTSASDPRYASWDKFSTKALVQSDEDDDEEVDEEEEEGGDDDDDDDEEEEEGGDD
jgi:hypothetical protein